MRKIFYQDFLFEDIKTDASEFPLIELEYFDSYPYCEEYYANMQKGLFDSLSIKLSQLIELTKEKDWNTLFAIITKYKSVYLIDDIPLENDEVKEYKDFYLKTYFYKIKNYCSNCFITDSNSIA